MTFNYDISLDYALRCKGIPINYALDDYKNPSSIPLLKLHGSLNWAKCSKCDKIYPWDVIKFTDDNYNFLVHGECRDNDHAIIPIGSNINKFIHNECKQKPERTPVIVPPTWNKTEYHYLLHSVWNKAAVDLSEVENIFVIGYSYPISDHFFHYLYALGTVGDNLIKNFWVFDPYLQNIETRFKSLVGLGTKDRLKFFPNFFSEAGEIIQEYFLNSVDPEVVSKELISSRSNRRESQKVGIISP